MPKVILEESTGLVLDLSERREELFGFLGVPALANGPCKLPSSVIRAFVQIVGPSTLGERDIHEALGGVVDLPRCHSHS